MTHVEHIRKHFTYLMDNITLDTDLSTLVLQHGILTQAELEYITGANESQESIIRLMCYIMKVSDVKYGEFLECLIQTGHGHVVATLTESVGMPQLH